MRELPPSSSEAAGEPNLQARDMRPHRGDDVLVGELVRALYRRRWIVVAMVAAALAAAAVYNVLATPIYQARARLLIEPGSSRVVTFRPVVDDEQGNLEYYQTQYEVLRSRTLALRALEKLDPSSDGAEEGSGTSRARAAAVTALLDDLTVSPVKGSRLVDVKFRSPDPEYAARAANAVVQAYLDEKRDVRLQAGQEASRWLEERLAELREQVDSREGALQDYREQEDAVSLEDRQNIVVQKFAQLTSAATAARTERIERQSLHEQLRALQAEGRPLDTFPPILSNTFIQNLKADLAELQRERGQLAQQLGDLHPEMIAVNTAIAAAERRLAAELQKVVMGIENDFRAAQATERGLVAALDQQKGEVLELNRKSIGYGALKRDAVSTQQIFESVLQRVKETDLTGELQTDNARILDAAEVPRWPVWPRTWLNLIVALLGSLMLGAGLVVALETLHPRLQTAGDVGDALGLPLLGITPRILGLANRTRALDVESTPPAFQDAVRGIRASILLSPANVDVRTLAVTSTNVGEGKTVVAASLAISMARAGRRVLLVDADWRRPRIHQTFDLPRSPGLCDVITGNIWVSDAACETSTRGLWVLPAGAWRPESADLLDTYRLGTLVQGLGDLFDLVVIDSPPVMAVADASVIAHAASSVVFVVAVGATSPESARSAVERLTAAQADVIGVVLNKAHSGGGYYYPPAATEVRDSRTPRAASADRPAGDALSGVGDA